MSVYASFSASACPTRPHGSSPRGSARSSIETAFASFPPENLHVTIAFLGSRPASETDAIADSLRGAVEGVAEPVLTPARYRETRSVGMLVLEDDEGRATRIAEDAHRRLAELGVYEPEKRPWLPHVTVVRFRERPRLSPPSPGSVR